MYGTPLLIKKITLCMLSTTSLLSAVDLSKLSADDIYILGNMAHEEGDFELSRNLLRIVAPRGRSNSLIDLQALRMMQWDEAYNFYSPDYWWHNGKITGKRIFIKHDGGIGDAVQFLRYVQQLHNAGAFVMLETPPVLVALYNRCPYIDMQIPYGQQPDHADSIITLSTPQLTYAVRNTIEERFTDVPYIWADRALCSYWRVKFSEIPGKKIGLSWCSSPLYHQKTHQKAPTPRSIPLTLFEPMLAYQPCSFISLQCDYGSEQIDTVQHKPIVFAGIDTQHGRLMDTMAIMKNLDLMITIDTSLAHIAGAMGVPVWLILPKCSDFRWFTERSDSPWYPTMRIFRQKPYEDWAPVLEEVFEALKEFCCDN